MCGLSFPLLTHPLTVVSHCFENEACVRTYYEVHPSLPLCMLMITPTNLSAETATLAATLIDVHSVGEMNN